MKLSTSIYCLALLAALSQSAPADELSSLALPGQDWAVSLEAPGFEVTQIDKHPTMNAIRLLATNKQTDCNLSIFIEEAVEPGESTKCRSFVLSKIANSPLKPEEFREYEREGTAYLEYIVREHQGERINFKNINAFLVHDGTWIDVHWSKVKFKRGEERLYESLLDSVAIVDRPAQEILNEGMELGSLGFHVKDYSSAIHHYNRALRVEQSTPTLSKELFVVLIDNLGMAYGISGDLDNARKTLLWGVERYPGYPMFYYNLACTEAESGNPEQALSYLRQAHDLLPNASPLDQLPDPGRDDSFKSLRRNREFKDLVKAFRKFSK